MFELEVSNLGIVKEAKLDIKPFTIFIGENNTNKSWTAYSLYGILHKKNIQELTKDYLNLKGIIDKSEFKEFINSIIDKLLNSSFSSIEIKITGEVFEEYINLLLRDLSKIFSKSFISSFFSLEDNFRKTKINLKIANEFINSLKKEFINSTIDSGVKSQDTDIIKMYKGPGEKNLTIEVINMEEIPIKYLKRALSDLILNLFINYIFVQNHIFPSERKALATFSERLQRKLPISEKLPYELMFEIYLKEEFDFPIFLEDFIKLVSNFRKNTKSAYSKLLNYLQKIIGGKIIFDEHHEYITYIPENTNVELPVYSTSSMVKTLSSFYLYLEKLAKGKDLVILDEPEMNLHPKAQTEFLELLTAFVNGIDKTNRNLVIATTHTPYILDHLENLLDAYYLAQKNEEYRKKLKEYSFLKSEKSFINPDNVNAYYFSTDGKVENIYDPEIRRFDKSTFAKIGGEIIRFEQLIYELEGD